VSWLLCAEWSYILWVHSFFLLLVVLLYLVCFGFCSLLLEVVMRRSVNKRRGARRFNGQARKTKSVNVARPGRGGFRL